jgi:hypothetical protein
MRVGAPVFWWTWHWGGCSKIFSRSEVMTMAARDCSGFAALSPFRTKEAAGHKSLCCLPRPVFLDKESDSSRALRSQVAAQEAPDRSSHSSRPGCSFRPTQTVAALGCQRFWSATGRGITSVERSQLGRPGWLRSGPKAYAALARAAVSRSGSKTVLFLSMK